MMICPVCQKNEAVFRQYVDVYSNTDIPCCADCADFLIVKMRYQWGHNAPQKWRKENKVKLDNAREALRAEYKAAYANRR